MISSQSSLEIFQENLKLQLLNIYPPPDFWSLRSRCKASRQFRSQITSQIASQQKNYKGAYENVISSTDGRKRINTPDKWPYSVHGVIEGKFGDDTFHGTGIMIGPNIVFTAGHNLYYYEKEIYADFASLRFKPATNGQLFPFEGVKVDKYFVSPNFVNEEKDDFGIMILTEPIGEETGYFGLACVEPSELAYKKISIAGFPDDKVKSKSGSFELWEMEGSVYQIDEERDEIHYKIDTSKGQSGGGVVFEENGRYFVCGVHVRGDETINIATLLTKQRYEQIYQWIQQNKVNLSFCFYERLELKSDLIDSSCMKFLFGCDIEDIGSLVLRCEEIEVEGVNILAKNTSLANLLELRLSENSFGDEGAEAIAQNTSWAMLSQLILDGNKISHKGAQAIGRNTFWTHLEKLNLSRNMIGAKGARAIAQNTSWINLSQLKLSGNKIGNEGARAIGQNTSWTYLSELDLSHNNIGNEGAEVIRQSPFWIHLKELNLSRNSIGAKGAELIGQNISWKNLSKLNLSWNNIGDDGAKGLAQNASWINLSQLSLCRNKIGDDGAKGIGQNTSWINLSRLDLSCNKIGDEGARSLAQNTSWIGLLELDLFRNNIGNKGAKAIGKNTSWTHLKELDLSSNQIGDKGARAIGQNTFRYLSDLNLSWNNIADQGVKELTQNLNPQFNYLNLKLDGNNISDKGAEAIAQKRFLLISLGWNYISYEGAQRLSKHLRISNAVGAAYWTSDYFKFNSIGYSQLQSTWETIETSKTFDPLRILFTSNYRLFAMNITPLKHFEDFVINISHRMHSRLYFNFSLLNTENEDYELTEALEFNTSPFFRAFSGNNQLYIEEANQPRFKKEDKIAAQNSSNLNFNSKNFSEEDVQPPLKNTYLDSS